MNLAARLLDKINDPNISRNERAQYRCQLSKEFEESGNYEGARGAMGDLWQRIGERPKLKGLNRETAAEVLLQAGRLTTCIGNAKQTAGAQELAKDLITQSILLFETLDDAKKVAEAKTDIAVCYLRLGAYDEARIVLQNALLLISDEDIELKALALLRSAIVEKESNQLQEALRIHSEANDIFETISNLTLKGKFHNEFAQVLESVGATERREDFIDKALIEYAAALFHLEQSGHKRYQARVENNVGLLFFNLGKYAEAHEHVGRARGLFSGLKDSGSVAETDDTRAQILLAEGRAAEAAKVAHEAVKVFETGDQWTLLADALTTQGKALSRLKQWEEARDSLRCALKVREKTGVSEKIGRAALMMIDELGEHLAPMELYEMYERAEELLAKSEDAGLSGRMRLCRRRVMQILLARLEIVTGDKSAGVSVHGRGECAREVSVQLREVESWEDFSLREEVRRYEERVIERALREANGVVSRAAQLLGFRHHHSLIALLKGRHRKLSHARSPVVRRRRSIMLESSLPASPSPSQRVRRGGGSGARGGAERGVRRVTVLYAEDDANVLDAVRETLRLEGWRIDACEEGEKARRKIESGAAYDVLLLDNDLPGVSGMELMRRARGMEHRGSVPVVILSASDCGVEALGAGADAFLKKPEDMLALVETIARLLASRPRPR